MTGLLVSVRDADDLDGELGARRGARKPRERDERQDKPGDAGQIILGRLAIDGHGAARLRCPSRD